MEVSTEVVTVVTNGEFLKIKRNPELFSDNKKADNRKTVGFCAI